MTEIEKLKEGRRISKQEYSQAKAAFQQAYENADAATRAKLDGLMQSSQNYSVADPMNNRSKREFDTQMYLNGVAIANGSYQQAPVASASTKNIFNGYSTEESRNNANAITNRYLASNQSAGVSQGIAGTTTSGSTQTGNFHQFKWNKSLTNQWSLDTESFEDKFGRFVDGLAMELSKARDAKESGKTLRGIASDFDFDGAISYLADLKSNVGVRDRKESISKLLRLAGPLKIDEAGFTNFFGDSLPQATEADKNKQLRINEGYKQFDLSSLSPYVKRIAEQNGFNFMTKDGKIFAFDQNWNLVNNPFASIDDDYTTEGREGSTYGHGLFIDANGNVFAGDTSAIGEGHQFEQAYKDAVQGMNRSGLFLTKNWKQGDSYAEDELTNQLAEIAAEKYPALQNYSFTDVGALFAGNTKVIAFNEDGSELETDRFGNVKLTPSTRYIYMGNDGLPHIEDFVGIQQNVGKYDRKGYQGENNKGTGDAPTSMKGIFENAEQMDSGRNYTKYGWGDFFKSIGAGLATGFAVDAATGFTDGGAGTIIGGTIGTANAIGHGISRMFTDDTIGGNQQEFVNNVLQALADPSKEVDGSGYGSVSDMNGRQYLDWLGWNSGDKEKILATVGNMVANNEVKLTPEQRRQFQKLVKENYATLLRSRQISSQKLGGILKMEYGDTIRLVDGKATNTPTMSWHERFDQTKGVRKMEKDAGKAKELGYSSLRQMDAAKDTNAGWTTSDTLRAAALAQDVAGLIGAISGAATLGGGSIAAEVTGITSMLTDLAADAIDPSVSAGQVVKNAAINTALGAGAFLGAKAPKVIASAAKLIPHIMVAAGTAGVAFDDSVHKTVKKLTSGKESLNQEDWHNIYMVLRTATGLGTYGATGIKNHRVNKRIKEKAEITTVESQLDPNMTYIKDPNGGEPIAVEKGLAKEVQDLMKAGKADEAKTKLREYKDADNKQILSDTQIDSLTDTSRNWRDWFKKSNNTDQTVTPKEKTSTALDPEKVQQLIADERARVGNDGWQGVMNKLDRAALKIAHPFTDISSSQPITATEIGLMRKYGINPLSAKAASKLDAKVQSEIDALPYAFDESAFETIFDEKAITNELKAQRQALVAAEKTATGENAMDLKRRRLQLERDIQTLENQEITLAEKKAQLKGDEARAALAEAEEFVRTKYAEQYNPLVDSRNAATKRLTEFDVNSKDPAVKKATKDRLKEIDAEIKKLTDEKDAGRVLTEDQETQLKELTERRVDDNLLSANDKKDIQDEIARLQQQMDALTDRKNTLNDLDDTNIETIAGKKKQIEDIKQKEKRLQDILDKLGVRKDSKNTEVADVKTKYDQLRRQISSKADSVANAKEADLVNLAQKSADARKIKKNTTVKDTNGVDVKIEKDKSVISLVGRDEAKAEKYAQLAAGNDAKKIDKSELQKIIRNTEKIHGAFVAKDGTVYVYKHGGSTKYSHLRK